MNYIKKTFLIATFLPVLAFAETKSNSPVDASEQYFHATETSTIVNTLIDELIRRANDRLHQSNLPEANRKLHAQKIVDIITSDIGQGTYQQQVKGIFSKFLTEQEMLEIAAFYNTETGKKLKQVQRNMNDEVYKTTIDWLDMIAKKVEALY